jgi:hypothetical protein
MEALLRLHGGSVKALIFHGFDKASAEGSTDMTPPVRALLALLALLTQKYKY